MEPKDDVAVGVGVAVVFGALVGVGVIFVSVVGVGVGGIDVGVGEVLEGSVGVGVNVVFGAPLIVVPVTLASAFVVLPITATCVALVKSIVEFFAAISFTVSVPMMSLPVNAPLVGDPRTTDTTPLATDSAEIVFGKGGFVGSAKLTI